MRMEGGSQNPRLILGVLGLFTAPCFATRRTAVVSGLLTTPDPDSAALASL